MPNIIDIIDTYITANGSNDITGPVLNEVLKEIVTALTSNIKPTISAGDTITDARLIDREVAFVIIDDLIKNSGYDKPTVSNTLTFTDGTLLGGTEKVIIGLT